MQKSGINKDRKSLHSITEIIKNPFNLFDDNIDKNILFNISTGKSASSDFLPALKSAGNHQKLNFISEYFSVSGRFKKQIRQNKILNFASQSVNKSLAKQRQEQESFS